MAKAILLQAETEVTAEKRSAIPLAQVAAGLLATVPFFEDIFYAKLCQRAGGWPSPIVIPGKDIDGRVFTPEERKKVIGFRQDEGRPEYVARVSGLMRLYFHIMACLPPRPLDPRFRMPRLWTWLARRLDEPQLLQNQVAAEILFGMSSLSFKPRRGTDI